MTDDYEKVKTFVSKRYSNPNDVPDVRFKGQWNGYDVWMMVHKNVPWGRPLRILVKGDDIRYTTIEESSEIQRCLFM